jgi:hypothetical protein
MLRNWWTGAQQRAVVQVATGSDLPIWAVGAYLFLSGIVLFYSFAEHPACLFTGSDGHLLRDAIDQARVFRRPFSQIGIAPLSGMFDANWPENRDYFFSEMVGMIVAGGNPSKPLTFTLCSILLIWCSYLLGCAIGISRSAALTVGLLVPIVIMPVFQGESSLAYLPLFNVDPYFSQGIALWMILVTALWRLCGRWNFSSIAWLPVPTVCIFWMVLASAPMIIVMAPYIATYGGASLLDLRRWHQGRQRAIAAVLIVPVALVCGFLTYQVGLYRYTAYSDFGNEFVTPTMRHSVTFVSIAFEGRVGKAILALAYIGAAYTMFSGPRRLRIIAAIFLVSTTIFLAIAYIIVTQMDYHGILPSYFESYLIPIYLLFAVLAATGVAAMTMRLLSMRQKWRQCAALGAAYLLPAVVIVGVATWNVSKADVPDTLHCQRAGLPIRSTPITDRLVDDVSIAPKRAFRGLVATFNNGGDFDSNLWVAIGNDHRDVGLWEFQIPTLYERNTFMTPTYYLMLTEFLVKPPAEQVRSNIRINHPDETMLKLWGVRYLITDFDPQMGRRVVEMPVPTESELPPGMDKFYMRDAATLAHESKIQILTQLDGSNRGDYSPPDIRHVDDFASGLAIMHRPDFDGRAILVTDAAAGAWGPLVPAADATLVLTTTGFDISASSSGESVLVLPVQYSHCWSSPTSGVELFRADLMQLGVRFRNKLDAKLVFRFGPLFAGRCRVDDAADMDRLKIKEARKN